MKYCWMLALAACGGRTGEVTVFAASSLRETLEEIGTEWSRREGRGVRFRFEASSTLGRQIGEGAKADVFVSAAPEWVTGEERFDWLTNRLVLVVPKDAPDPDLRALASLAIANEQVPAGRYARAALAHLGVPIPARTIYGANARDVLSKVSQGGAAAGIVYATDAAVDPEVRIAFPFPPESHPKIVYVAALLDPQGRGFYEALRSDWARAIAQRNGF